MAGMTEKRLRSVIENGLPGTTMSAWKTVLSPDDINAITAYILQWMPSAPHADHLESPTDRENQ